jgi:hypothetical protein
LSTVFFSELFGNEIMDTIPDIYHDLTHDSPINNNIYSDASIIEGKKVMLSTGIKITIIVVLPGMVLRTV